MRMYLLAFNISAFAHKVISETSTHIYPRHKLYIIFTDLGWKNPLNFNAYMDA